MPSSPVSTPTSHEAALLAQASPCGLGLATSKRFAYPPHLQLLDHEITEAIARGRIRRHAIETGKDIDDRAEIIVVAMPPRHGKSTVMSEHTPAWYLGCFPDDRVILCSYGAEFAATWGEKARNKLERYGPELFGVQVDERSKARQRWRLAGHTGSMLTAGVGGPITGEGAELMIIDDPLKDAEEALSETIRDKQWDWWQSTARTRLEPGAVVIVLMTRWHEADLAGKLLSAAKEGGDPVREIRLPALAGEKDPLGRKKGEALWPRRFTRRYLEHTRDAGAYWFAAMYQGTPAPEEGGLFNRRDFNYFEVDEDNELVVLSRPDGTEQSYGINWCTKFDVADLAASEKEKGDYTVVGELWVTPDGDLLVKEVYRDHIPVPDQPKFFETHHSGGTMKFESIGYQSGIVKTMLRRGFPAEPVYPDKDKVTRAAAPGVLYRSGKIYHRAGAGWLNDFELELLAFPNGDHDDQVDMLAYGAKAMPEILKTRKRADNKRKAKTMTGGLMSEDL